MTTIELRADSTPWEHYHFVPRGAGVAAALQVTFVCLAACEDDFCGYEQECARIHGGRFSADDSLKFSQEVSFSSLHSRIVKLRAKAIKITIECYCRARS